MTTVFMLRPWTAPCTRVASDVFGSETPRKNAASKSKDTARRGVVNGVSSDRSSGTHEYSEKQGSVVSSKMR